MAEKKAVAVNSNDNKKSVKFDTVDKHSDVNTRELLVGVSGKLRAVAYKTDSVSLWQHSKSDYSVTFTGILLEIDDKGDLIGTHKPNFSGTASKQTGSGNGNGGPATYAWNVDASYEIVDELSLVYAVDTTNVTKGLRDKLTKIASDLVAKLDIDENKIINDLAKWLHAQISKFPDTIEIDWGPDVELADIKAWIRKRIGAIKTELKKSIAAAESKFQAALNAQLNVIILAGTTSAAFTRTKAAYVYPSLEDFNEGSFNSPTHQLLGVVGRGVKVDVEVPVEFGVSLGLEASTKAQFKLEAEFGYSFNVTNVALSPVYKKGPTADYTVESTVDVNASGSVSGGAGVIGGIGLVLKIVLPLPDTDSELVAEKPKGN